MRAASRRSALLRFFGYAASVAIVAWLVFVVFPELGDVEGAGELLATHLRVDDVLGILAVLALYLLTHAMTLTTAEPKLAVGAATQIRAVNGGIGRFIPAGWALGAGALAAMLRARGLSRSAVGHAIAVTAVWNTLTKLSFPLLGLVPMVLTGELPDSVGWIVVGAVISILAVVVALWAIGHERVGRKLGRAVERPASFVATKLERRPPTALPEQVVAFQASTREALRERPLAMAGWYFAHHATHVALVFLGMSVAAGGELFLGWPEVLTAFGIGYLLTGLPISPGGLGTLDVAVVAVLTQWGEDPGVVSAGLIVYRVAIYGLYGPVLASWPLWRRRT